jgi:dephospho-CoA kinase
MIKVGVTGGIGSGKSMVCEVFARLGIRVYHADDQAKILMNDAIHIRQQLTEKFGQEIYKDNQLNRPLLANIIFNDKAAITFVNSIVHPAVADNFEAWCASEVPGPYVIEEAALLFESGAYNLMDKMVTVCAPFDVRLKRVMLRDNVTEEQVLRRMNNQLSEGERLKQSDFVVYNDEKTSILEQVLKLHKLLVQSKKY